MENGSRVALVTGGAKRVGRAIALRLAAGGFDVGFTYLSSEADAKSLVQEIEGMGRKCLAIRVDLSDSEKAAGEILGAYCKTFTGLNVLVNNASIYEASGLRETNVGQMRRFWAVHVESPLMICQKFEGMLRAGRGRVINMVDLLAERPWPDYLSYCTSKAGLLNLTLGLARSLAPEVTVNGIAPGVVEWPRDYPEEMKEKYLKRVPLGRAGTPGDVAEAVWYLAGNGGYVTGQILHLDGGRGLT